MGISREDFFKLVQIVLEYDQHTLQKLNNENGVLMVLVELRHYPTISFLSIIFQLPKTTCYDCLVKYKDIIYNVMKFYISTGTLELRIKESGCLKFSNQLVSEILDGTEQPSESTGDLMVEPGFYSTKKSQHSFNITLGISPLFKRVLWVSKSYGGSVSDAQICIEEHGWYLPDELIIGDQGYNALSNHIFCLPKGGEIGRLFSSERTKVENAISDLKVWLALKYTCRLKIKNPNSLIYHNINWVICSALRNRFLLPDNHIWYPNLK